VIGQPLLCSAALVAAVSSENALVAFAVRHLDHLRGVQRLRQQPARPQDRTARRRHAIKAAMGAVIGRVSPCRDSFPSWTAYQAYIVGAPTARELLGRAAGRPISALAQGVSRTTSMEPDQDGGAIGFA